MIIVAVKSGAVYGEVGAVGSVVAGSAVGAVGLEDLHGCVVVSV